MDIEELDRTSVGKTLPEQDSPSEEFTPDYEEQMLTDVQEAIELFATVKTLLDYVSNTDLCKVVSHRERTIMSKVSEKVRIFLAATEPTYLESEGE